jgi:hypothetical protein
LPARHLGGGLKPGSQGLRWAAKNAKWLKMAKKNCAWATMASPGGGIGKLHLAGFQCSITLLTASIHSEHAALFLISSREIQSIQ